MGKLIEPYEPKILLFDIETAPILAHVWGIWDQNVGLNMIEADWHLLSFSAKWLGKDEITYFDQRNCKDIENDKQILRHLWKMMDEADVIVGHNLDKFDIKKVNTRFLLHKMKPPSDYRTIDTLKIARQKFAFTSNKLEHLADKLNLKSQKSKHKDFPGFELWKQCLAGNLKAWKEMEEYNKMDVIVLEAVYEKLMPWYNKINFSTFAQGLLCQCGGTEFTKYGHMFTNGGKYQRMRCRKCGSMRALKENLIDKDVRSGLLK